MSNQIELAANNTDLEALLEQALAMPTTSEVLDQAKTYTDEVISNTNPIELQPIPNGSYVKAYNNEGEECSIIGMSASNTTWVGSDNPLANGLVLASQNKPMHYDGAYHNLITTAGGQTINGSFTVKGGFLTWDAQGNDQVMRLGSSGGTYNGIAGRIYLGCDMTDSSVPAATMVVSSPGDVSVPSTIMMPKLPAGTGTTLVQTNATYGNIGKASSARRYKENIVPIDENEADIIDSFEPVTFNYIGQDDVRAYGVIADDVEKFAPDLCYYQEKLDENGEPTGEMEIESVSYQGIQMLMLKEIQRLRRRVAALEGGKE